MIDPGPIILTLKLAILTTLILTILGIPIAYWIAYGRFRLKPLVETLVTMPLVLPPTVLGFYILVAFSPNRPFGRFLDENFGLRLVFSFEGLIMASVIFSLPFMIHPILAGFRQLPESLAEASYVLGRSKLNTLLRIQLPNIRAALLTGMVLAFSHTIGEFGVVLMIGGNIPDQTRVASIAIYDEVEALNYTTANTYSLILLGITFSILLLVYMINGGYLKSRWR
jgi:molybdate transport system permease protein